MYKAIAPFLRVALFSILFPTSIAFAAEQKMPGFFVENAGQFDSRVRFVLTHPELTVNFLDDRLIVGKGNSKLPVVFVGAQKGSSVKGGDTLPGKANFFLGHDPKTWKTDVPLHQTLRYDNLWAGVTVLYSVTSDVFKSDFLVAPGADPGQIRWDYGAGRKAVVAQDGSLGVSIGGDHFQEGAPKIYQLLKGVKVPVSGAYRVHEDGTVGFTLGNYDRSRELVIDPVISFSTFLGGTGQDKATGIALDKYGNGYITGWTTSSDLLGSYQKVRASAGSVDAFVLRLNATGTGVVFCTFLGGAGDDRAFGIAVDGTGNSYVTGWTSSSNFPVFPVVGSLSSRLSGTRDAFVAKLTPSGSIAFSMFLGGSGQDSGNAIALDSANNIYVTGDTKSVDFPVTFAFQLTNKGGQDAFLTKINAAGNGLIYSTYLGGAADEHSSAIAVGSDNSAYVTGSTYSPDFPVAKAAQKTTGGNQDGFITKFSPAGVSLVYSTFIGGSGGTPGLIEEGESIALDSAGNVFVGGTTSSADFPVTRGAFQTTFSGGNTDCFVVKLSAAGDRFLYSTYIGGSAPDSAAGIALDFLGDAYLVGYTGSQDFPTWRPMQPANRGGYDAFVTKLNSAGSGLVYSTYLGGTGSDAATGIAVDRLGNALVSGFTSSRDYPLKVAFQQVELGVQNAFVTKICSPFTIGIYDSASGNAFVDLVRNLGWDGQRPSYTVSYFGQPGDIPVFGDWTGTGVPRIGVFRNGTWMLDINGNGYWDGPAGGDKMFTFGQAGDIPLVGDWTGSGKVSAGLFRRGYWILDLSGHLQGTPTGVQDRAFYFGSPQNIPVVGDWTGDGTTKIGIFHDGYWVLDMAGRLDGSYTVFFFGKTGDIPIVGDWDGSGIAHPGIFRQGFWSLGYTWEFDYTSGYGPRDLGFYFGPASAVPLAAR